MKRSLYTKAPEDEEGADELMTINVATLTGTVFQLDVLATDTVLDCKEQIQQEEGIPVDRQILLWQESTLADHTLIGESGIVHGAHIKLVVQMCGGPGSFVRHKKAREEESSVVLLLCKQEEELYLVEVNMKDGKTRRAVGKFSPDALAGHSQFLPPLAMRRGSSSSVASSSSSGSRSFASELAVVSVLPPSIATASMFAAPVLPKQSIDTKVISAPASKPPSVDSLVEPSSPESSKTATQRCHCCHKKLGLTTSFACRCGHEFCGVHRYSDKHACTFDYRNASRQSLEDQNPLVVAPKLNRI